jgi:predicted RNA-binding protein with RPS1 domain
MEVPVRPAVAEDCFSDSEESAKDSAPDAADLLVSGHVTRVERYGCFVSLSDGRQGLLHRSEHPRSRRFELGDALSCTVKAVSKQGLQLTTRWSKEQLAAISASGAMVPATVTGVKAFGAFLDVGGESALLHRSATDYAEIGGWLPWQSGDALSVRVLGRDSQDRLQVTQRGLFLRPARPRRFLDLGDVCLERLRCFHSKAPLGEAVFGVGVAFEPEELPNGQKRYHLSSVYDVLALESFRDGVRRGVWKQKFAEFLPLALDAEHFAQGRRALEDLVAKLSHGAMAQKLRSHGKSRDAREAELNAGMTLDEYRSLKSTPKASPVAPEPTHFAPSMLLDIIPKLMNAQIVLISSGQLWRSQKALEGYFAYHHLLLHCLRAYPKLRERVERSLEAFQQSPERRSKEAVPNLGEFLCLLSVSDSLGWQELGVPILEEAFARNALWILKQAPKLGELTDVGESRYRLRKSFQANLVSLRLLMFQVAFLQLAKPAGQKASCALERKDRCKGLPGPGEAEWLFRRCVRILSVEDWDEFLDLVGAAPMDGSEVCRWLRRAMITSISRGYHNPGHFSRLCAPKQKSAEPSGQDYDPDDFGMDTRKKESKAEKRARRKALLTTQAAMSVKDANMRAALNWARFRSGGRFEPRQGLVMLSDKHQLETLEAELDSDGALQCSFGSAKRGWRILDGKVLSKVKSFPAWLTFGRGCRDCQKLVTVEVSGRCMPCCRVLAAKPQEAHSIKGLDGPSAPQAQFTMFQAEAVVPVEFEMQMEVKFDGLVADVKPLRQILSPDLELTSDLAGIVVFTRVSRMGRRLFEKAPEQVMVPGSKLVSGWQGVTDARVVKKGQVTVTDGLFTATVRNVQFTLLRDTMHDLTVLEDLDLLRMTRTYCRDHKLRDASSKEVMCRSGHVLKEMLYPHHYGGCSECHASIEHGSETMRCNHCNYDLCRSCTERNQGVTWNRPCQNCRGVLRLRFRAPQRYAQRQHQLEQLSAENLARRAAYCGLLEEAADVSKRKELITHIIKSEKIIR